METEQYILTIETTDGGEKIWLRLKQADGDHGVGAHITNQAQWIDATKIKADSVASLYMAMKASEADSAA